MIILNTKSTLKIKHDCPPHKWTYGLDNQMFCKTCKRRPGDNSSSYDKPY